MGEVKKEGGGKNAGDGKKDAGKPAVVMKMEIHCDSCVNKIEALVRISSGVEDVDVDVGGNKQMVKGKVDPAKLREKLESKTHKKIELVSPPPAKYGGFEMMLDPKSEKKPKIEKPTPKESTMTLKIELHCEGCAKKIKTIISEIEGVNSVKIDLAKDLMMVTGTLEVEDLVPYFQKKLEKKLKKVVAMVLVQPKNDEGVAGAADKKEKPPAPAVAKGSGGDGGKKKKDEGKKDGGKKKKDEGKKDGGEKK